MGNKGCLLHKGDGTDQKVIGADQSALAGKIRAQPAINLRRLIIKRDASEVNQEIFNGFERTLRLSAPIGTVVEFRFDDGANSDVLRLGVGQLLVDK